MLYLKFTKVNIYFNSSNIVIHFFKFFLKYDLESGFIKKNRLQKNMNVLKTLASILIKKINLNKLLFLH